MSSWLSTEYNQQCIVGNIPILQQKYPLLQASWAILQQRQNECSNPRSWKRRPYHVHTCSRLIYPWKCPTTDVIRLWGERPKSSSPSQETAWSGEWRPSCHSEITLQQPLARSSDSAAGDQTITTSFDLSNRRPYMWCRPEIAIAALQRVELQ